MGRHTPSLTVRVSYLACASIGNKSRGGGRLLVSSIEQAPRLVDYKGSLDSTPLLSLLQSMQAQRATGTLQVRNGGEAFSLFFLFGHLVPVAKEIIFFIMNCKAVCTHGSKTFSKFLLHGVDGSINTYQCHDAKRDDGYSNAGPEFIAPHRSKGKRKNIA